MKKIHKLLGAAHPLVLLGMIGAIMMFTIAVALAGYPQWWTDRGVVDANAASTNDYAAANQGQLKHIATAAHGEFSDKLTSVDLSVVSNMVIGFSGSNDYAALNLGQLKYVASPFYDVLWSNNLTNVWPSGVTSGPYPWQDASSNANDYALVNLGQLKYVFSFDLNNLDIDDDGMPDWWEQENFGGIVFVSGSTPSPDGDGRLTCYEKWSLQLDPFDSDYDDDGLSDYDEDDQFNPSGIGTSPLLADTDGDGFGDYDEYTHSMNPVEQAVPGSADWEGDADGDGLSNGFELQNLLNPFRRQDSDFDGLWDDQETIEGTDRYDSDTDNDGFSDSEEFYWGYTSPLTNEGFYAVDSDGDGLPGWQELAYYTNPTNSDTDADGFDDGLEVCWGSDPTNDVSFLVFTEGSIISSNTLFGVFMVYAESGENQYWGSVSNHLFSVTNIPNLLTYSVSAFRDSNSNTVQDAWEECGSTNMQLDASVNGVVITTVIPDDDEDGLPDWWEYTECGGDIDPDGDEDADGVSNYTEYTGGTNPLEPDSDRDGVLDGAETGAGTSATNAASTASLIRGFVRNDSGTTGTVHVLISTSSNNWSTARQETVSTDGGYSVEGLAPSTAYYLRAFVDADSNGAFDSGESWADYAANAITPQLVQNDINIFIGTPLLLGDGDGDGVEDFIELLQGRDISSFATNDTGNLTELIIYKP